MVESATLPVEPSASPIVRQRGLLLLLLCLVCFVAPLGLRDLWYPDEPDIAEVNQAMYESGDWIAPRRMGKIWVDYPPLLYWMGNVTSLLLGGMSPFSLRLACALSALALVLLTCRVGSRWFDPKTGLWAGFVLLSFQHFVHEAVSYRPDLPFSVAIFGGFVLYALGTGARETRWWLRIAGFACLGLAFLAKGPLGLLLPGLVLTLWHAGRREWRRILELAPLALVAIAVALPWYLACGQAMGFDNLWYEIRAQNFDRFGGTINRGHLKPFHYYFAILPVDLLPWSLVLPVALWWVVRSRLWRDRNTQLLLWWLGTFFVFLSVAATKRQVYFLPAYPAAALLLAPWLVAVTGPQGVQEKVDRRLARIFVWVTVAGLLVVGVAFVGVALMHESLIPDFELPPAELATAQRLPLPVAAAGLIAIAGALWIGRRQWRGDLAGSLARVGLAFLAVYMVVIAWAFTVANPIKTYRPAGEWLRAELGAEQHYGLFFPVYGYNKRGGFGYHVGPDLELIESRDEMEAFLREHPESLVVVHETALDQVEVEDDPWQPRPVRELMAGGYHFQVFAAP